MTDIAKLVKGFKQEVREKAIDEFFENLEEYMDGDGWLRLKISSIYEIAEQLKGGEK